jgi:hypothetical protein
MSVKPVTRILILSILGVLALATVACSGDSDDAGDGPATPSPTSAPSTPEISPTVSPTQTPAPTETPTPLAGEQTGIDAVDEVIEAVETGDAAGLEALLRFTKAPCTSAFGGGGPPKCFYYQPAPVEGTVVEAFPLSTCEGEWRTELAPIVEMLFDRELALYGVVKLNLDGPVAGFEYYPQPEYGVLLQHEVSGETGGILLGVEEEGGVTYIDFVCFGPPDWFLSEQARVAYGDGVELIFEGPAFE